MSKKQVQAICEDSIPEILANGRLNGSFRMSQVISMILELDDVDRIFPKLREIQAALPARISSATIQGLLRTAFFIEPVVLPDCATTRFATRWQVGSSSDPRRASTDQCIEIFNTLSGEILDWITESGPAVLSDLLTNNMVAYEMPFEYENREGKIHRVENIMMIPEDVLSKVVGLRAELSRVEGNLSQVFQAAYKKKVAIKSYLTDRVLTGIHKTNREKRWEAHPDSVHFASRQRCMEIEYELISSICHFDGFPKAVYKVLIEKGVLDERNELARCPVTLETHIFADFANELLNPDHGRSAFQVGHMDPLKLDGNEWTDGHRHSNISWISADGNRIQGSQSVSQTRSMLKKIWHQYQLNDLL